MKNNTINLPQNYQVYNNMRDKQQETQLRFMLLLQTLIYALKPIVALFMIVRGNHNLMHVIILYHCQQCFLIHY